MHCVVLLFSWLWRRRLSPYHCKIIRGRSISRGFVFEFISNNTVLVSLIRASRFDCKCSSAVFQSVSGEKMWCLCIISVLNHKAILRCCSLCAGCLDEVELILHAHAHCYSQYCKSRLSKECFTLHYVVSRTSCLPIRPYQFGQCALLSCYI
jgi:hypothetical protein